jgi:hypothetical protein
MVDQIIQAEQPILPIEYQNYPVSVRLRIWPVGTRYDIELIAEEGYGRWPIDMSPQDLKTLNQELQREMEAVISDNVKGNELTANELADQILPLAEVGNYAFRSVFSNPEAKAFIKGLATYNQIVSIQIASEDFFLPWELMYPVSLDEPLSYDHFWGMNYIIQRIIATKGDRPGEFVSPVMRLVSPPKLGLLTYSGLRSVAEKEGPFFETLASDKKISLFRLRALDPNNKREEFREFKTFWSNAFHLAHFACHAFYEDGSPERSRLLLSNEFDIRLMDLVIYNFAIEGHPLIIMNACQTGNLNPLHTSYFAQTFLKHGARGVVATECIVPDTFAADFAENLYTQLLQGTPLGQSLLATRRYFLENYHNPTALLYSMYAPPSIQLLHTGA